LSFFLENSLKFLKKAIEIYPRYKEMAEKDEDFKNLNEMDELINKA